MDINIKETGMSSTLFAGWIDIKNAMTEARVRDQTRAYLTLIK